MIEIYKKILGLYGEYNSWNSFILLLLYLAIIGAARIYEPFFVKELVDLMQVWIVEPVDLAMLQDILIRWGAYIGLMILFRYIGLIRYKRKWVNVYVGEYARISRIAHQMHFSQYLSMSKSAFSKIVNNGHEALWRLGSDFFKNYFYQFVTVISVVCVMFVVNWRLSILTLCMMPVMLWITLVMDPKTFRLQKALDELWNQGYAIIGDSMTNMGTVKTFTLEAKRDKALVDNTTCAKNKQLPLEKRRALHDTYMQIIVMIARLVVVGGGVWMYSANMTTIGEVILFFTYINFTYYPLMTILSGLDGVMRSVVAYKKLQTTLDILNKTGEEHLRKSGSTDLPQGDIVFKNVDFSYVTHQKILSNITFSIPSGKKVALVGHTGAGKSTVAHLLLRFWEVTQGRITWGDKDIRDISLDTLRKSIGVIMQDTTLFNTSIYNNLLWCIEGDIHSVCEQDIHAKITDALRKAQAEFVFRLPQGRDTIIGERGLKLSGGEKQRIALARLLLKNPQMILLDEATSALDTTTEFHIKTVIDEVFSHRTMLIIAHRLSTIEQADWVVVLDAGSIVEQGTYAELISKKGVLRTLANPSTLLL